MSTESLITNIEYNVKMDSDISISSNLVKNTDLFYAINFTDTQLYIPESKVYIKEENNKNSNLLTIIKFILSIIVLLLTIWFCFFYK